MDPPISMIARAIAIGLRGPGANALLRGSEAHALLFCGGAQGGGGEAEAGCGT